jgi:hypothetical protein
LLGSKEPALTGALGFVLSRSPALCDALLRDLELDGSVESVHLEQHGVKAADRTDIELLGEGVSVIIEAKRGWIIPTVAQLETYARRRPDVIVVVTDCSDGYARMLGLPEQLSNIPVEHRSWRNILEMVRNQVGAGRRWEGELLRYLESNVATMQDVESNQVYCVSLCPIGTLGGVHGKVYVDRGIYFHPHSRGWPQQPPTYLAFRYDSRVQTIRHVDAYEIVGDLRDGVEIDEVTNEADVARPHLVYQLGPHIGPAEPLPYGTNYRAARHWVFLDLLLTEETYQAVVETSRARRVAAGLA